MQSFFDTFGPAFGGGGNLFLILVSLLKIVAVIGAVQGLVPFIIVWERKLIAYMQVRPGPNRVGPWGLLQALVDGIKLFLKEDFIPKDVDKLLFYAAPAITVIAAFISLCAVPFGPVISAEHTAAIYRFLGIYNTADFPTTIPLAITNMNVGVLFVFAIASVGVYGITLAGWSSNNKWSLLGGLRASAQMISYEITMALSICAALLVAGKLNIFEIIHAQTGGVLNWFIWYQPIGFVLFVIAMFAETNRLPFDLPEAESELTGGYHTEYSSMKFALFFLAEYINMIVGSIMCCVLFLGGYEGLFAIPGAPSWFGYLSGPINILGKVSLFITFFVVVRGVLPRLRYDQLMDLGWKVMLPLGLINLTLTAVLFGLGVDNKWVHFFAGIAVLGATEVFFRSKRRKMLYSKYRYFSQSAQSAS